MKRWLGRMAGVVIFTTVGCGSPRGGYGARTASALDLSGSQGGDSANSGNANDSGNSSKSDSGNSSKGSDNSSKSDDSSKSDNSSKSDHSSDESAVAGVVVSSVAAAAVVGGLLISSSAKRAKKERRQRVEEFVSENIDSFRSDAARGGGETIDAVGKLADCPTESRRNLGARIQSVYPTLFMKETDGGADVAPRVSRYLAEIDCSL